MKRCTFLVAVSFAAILITMPASAGEMPMTTPDAVGLSGERLAMIGDTINSEIEAGHIAGGVLLVARHGKVAFLESYGMQDKLAGTPMAEDSSRSSMPALVHVVLGFDATFQR